MKTGSGQMRSRLPFGPATLAAAVLAVALSQRLPFPADRSHFPVRERKSVQVPVAGPLSPPEPAWVRRQAEELELSPTQRERLARLEQRWTHETEPAREALTTVSEGFAASARSAHDKAVSLRELQERAGPVSLLTGQLLVARRAWWEEASSELTTRQRQQAEHLWRQRFAKHSGSEEPLR